MKTFDIIYYRDGNAIGFNEWNSHLSRDIAAVQTKNPGCKIRDAVMADINRGLTSVVNQHEYTQVIID